MLYIFIHLHLHTYNIMDQFNTLISLLCPSQNKFNYPENPKTVLKNTPKETNISTLTPISSTSLDSINGKIIQQFQLPESFLSSLQLFEVNQRYNLYSSLLSQLSPKYNSMFTYEQQNELNEEFIRYMIHKIDSDLTIQQLLRQRKIKKQQLIDEIKNTNYQTKLVVWFASLMLDLNIIVFTDHQFEIYFSDSKYDSCKPHLLLYCNPFKIYQPIVYNNERTLNYYEHPILKIIMESSNKIEMKDIIFAN